MGHTAFTRLLPRATLFAAAASALLAAGACLPMDMATGGSGGDEPDPFATGAFHDDWSTTDRACAANGATDCAMMPMNPTGLPFHPGNLAAGLTLPGSVTKSLVIGTSSSCVSIDTDAGQFTDQDGHNCLDDGAVSFQRVLQADGSELGVFLTKNFALQRDMSARGKDPLVIVSFGALRIEGTLFCGGIIGQSGVGGPIFSNQGEGVNIHYQPGVGAGGGGAPNQMAGNTGGGGGGYCGQGGAGSGGIAGGMAYGAPQLVPLVAGSTGGVTDPASAVGGAGGAVQLVAASSITIATGGAVNAAGGGGGQFGMGGGSGGAILLEAPVVKINGTLSVNGGAGADGVDMGPNGTLTAAPAHGATNDTPGKSVTTGGDGGGGASSNGGAGSSTGTAASDDGDAARAGGGGGVGRVRINAQCAAGKLGPAAVITPDLCGACATVAKIQVP